MVSTSDQTMGACITNIYSTPETEIVAVLNVPEIATEKNIWLL